MEIVSYRLNAMFSTHQMSFRLLLQDDIVAFISSLLSFSTWRLYSSLFRWQREWEQKLSNNDQFFVCENCFNSFVQAQGVRWKWQNNALFIPKRRKTVTSQEQTQHMPATDVISWKKETEREMTDRFKVSSNSHTHSHLHPSHCLLFYSLDIFWHKKTNWTEAVSGACNHFIIIFLIQSA